MPVEFLLAGAATEFNFTFNSTIKFGIEGAG